MVKIIVTPEETYTDWMDDLVRQAAKRGFSCSLSKDTEWDSTYAEMVFDNNEEAKKYKKWIEKFYRHEVTNEKT